MVKTKANKLILTCCLPIVRLVINFNKLMKNKTLMFAKLTIAKLMINFIQQHCL